MSVSSRWGGGSLWTRSAAGRFGRLDARAALDELLAIDEQVPPDAEAGLDERAAPGRQVGPVGG
jgi:hypothetical protein